MGSIRSCVARVAVRRSLVLAMAADAEAHLEILGLLDDFHVLDLPVACLTREPARDVPLVAEVHVVRLAMNADPRHGLSGLVVTGHHLDGGLVGPHNGVAVHAHGHGGDRRVARALGIGVAVETGDLVRPGVKLVAEWNRLLWGIPDIAERIEKGPAAQDDQDQRDRKELLWVKSAQVAGSHFPLVVSRTRG